MQRHTANRLAEAADALRQVAQYHPASLNAYRPQRPLNPEYEQLAQASATLPETPEPTRQNIEPFFVRFFSLRWSKVFR
jgi:hypothetical protein